MDNQVAVEFDGIEKVRSADKDPKIADVLRALLLHMEVSKAKEKAERNHLGLSVKQLSNNMQRLAEAIELNTTRVSSAIEELAVRMENAATAPPPPPVEITTLRNLEMEVRDDVGCVDSVFVAGCSTYPACAGIYTRSIIEPHPEQAGRAIFTGPGSKHLFYWNSIHKWIIGDDPTKQKGWYSSTRMEGWCPTRATGWKELDTATGQFQMCSIQVGDAKEAPEDMGSLLPDLPGMLPANPDVGTDLRPLLPDVPLTQTVDIRAPSRESPRSNASSDFDEHFGQVKAIHGTTLKKTIAPEYIRIASNGQWLPCVEVSAKICRISNVDAGSLTFDCDFLLHLDWHDYNLDGFVGDLSSLDWGRRFFNPDVTIENAASSLQEWSKGSNTPRWYPSKSDPNRWLRKTMRYKGGMLMKEADMRCFPFDLQILPIHVAAVPCLSLAKVVKNKDKTKPPKDAFKFQLTHSHKKTIEDEYASSMHKGCGHYLTEEAGKLLVEFRPCHVTGCSMHSGGEYRVNVFVQRPWIASHTWNMLIVMFLTGVAMSSYYAELSLAPRMSITLIVILIIAVWIRPDSLARVPYSTLFDKCFKISLATALFISFSNIHVVMQCGGYNSLAIEFLQTRYNRVDNRDDLCEQGWCDSTKLDCTFFAVACGLWVLANGLVLAFEIFMRLRMSKQMKHSHESLPDVPKPKPLILPDSQQPRPLILPDSQQPKPLLP